MNEIWTSISEKLPPIGNCLIVTVKDHVRQCMGLRYPVYYMEKPFESGYAFFCGDTENILLPEYSEVVAWMHMPKPYDGD